ncbi:hypothetical protein BDV11DRAFT_85767 [Aspergillus similis]
MTSTDSVVAHPCLVLRPRLPRASTGHDPGTFDKISSDNIYGRTNISLPRAYDKFNVHYRSSARSSDEDITMPMDMTAKGRRLVSCTVTPCGDTREGPSHLTAYFDDHQKYGYRGPNLHLEIADLTEQGWPPRVKKLLSVRSTPYEVQDA